MTHENTEQLTAQLQKEMGECCFSDLKAALERSVVFLVHPDLELLNVGQAIALDEAEKVALWIEEKKLLRPTPAESTQWQEQKEGRFLSLIVQPYVLIQPQ